MRHLPDSFTGNKSGMGRASYSGDACTVWAVAVTQPQSEAKVADDLTDLGFKIFFPQIKSSVVRRGRRVYRIEPMFRRYVLVKMCENIFEALNVRRLVDLIRTANYHLATVPDCEVEPIRQRCNGDDILIVPRYSRFLNGELVRPKAGALVDLIGKYESALHNRELATFQLMGRAVTVSFKKGDLVSAA